MHFLNRFLKNFSKFIYSKVMKKDYFKLTLLFLLHIDLRLSGNDCAKTCQLQILIVLILSGTELSYGNRFTGAKIRQVRIILGWDPALALVSQLVNNRIHVTSHLTFRLGIGRFYSTVHNASGFFVQHSEVPRVEFWLTTCSQS